MEKLYKFNENSLRKVSHLDAIVTKAYLDDGCIYSAHNHEHRIALEVDVLKRPVYLREGYRIDNGEKVRMYSTKNFKGCKLNGNTDIYLSGIQILNENGEVSFQSSYNVNGHVVAFLSDEQVNNARERKKKRKRT